MKRFFFFLALASSVFAAEKRLAPDGVNTITEYGNGMLGSTLLHVQRDSQKVYSSPLELDASQEVLFAQIDENKVDDWFHGCRVTAGDIGEHNAGVGADAIANWPSAETEDEIKARVSLKHGLGQSVAAAGQTQTRLNNLIARAATQGVTLDSTVRIVFEGESTTAGTSTWAYDAWPERLARRSNWLGKGIFINQAQGSQSIAELTSQYAAQVFPYRPGQGGITESWLLVMIGIKDSRPGGTPPPASTIMAAIESYITTANNDGFTTVLCTTNYSDGMTPEEKQTILDLNTLIMASTVPDYKVDTIAALGQPDVQPSRYADTVHPNGDGYDIVADTINTAITP